MRFCFCHSIQLCIGVHGGPGAAAACVGFLGGYTRHHGSDTRVSSDPAAMVPVPLSLRFKITRSSHSHLPVVSTASDPRSLHSWCDFHRDVGCVGDDPHKTYYTYACCVVYCTLDREHGRRISSLAHPFRGAHAYMLSVLASNNTARLNVVHIFKTTSKLFLLILPGDQGTMPAGHSTTQSSQNTLRVLGLLALLHS